MSHAPTRTEPNVEDAAPRISQRLGRILLADDDADLRFLVADALRADGYDVFEAKDGGRLLVRISARYKPNDEAPPFDLIVSDVQMPVCTGLDILKALRDARWRTPVLLMTALASDDTRRRAERLGATILDKPFRLEELRARVRRLVTKGQFLLL